MRLLLDENFPADFAQLLTGHVVVTVQGLGWAGVKNGELLRRASSVCEAFLTLDRSPPFQQNIKSLPIGVLVVRCHSNRMADLVPWVPDILDTLKKIKPGQATEAGLRI